MTLTELRRIAMGATHKVWHEDQGDIIGFVESEGEDCALLDDVYGFADRMDREFIGAFHPQQAIALLDMVEGLQTTTTEVLDALDAYIEMAKEHMADKENRDRSGDGKIVVRLYIAKDIARAALEKLSDLP